MNRRSFLATLAGTVVGPPAAKAIVPLAPKPAPRVFTPFDDMRVACVSLETSIGRRPRPEDIRAARDALIGYVVRDCGKQPGPATFGYVRLPLPHGVAATYTQWMRGPGSGMLPVRYVCAYSPGFDERGECMLHRWDVAYRIAPIRRPRIVWSERQNPKRWT